MPEEIVAAEEQSKDTEAVEVKTEPAAEKTAAEVLADEVKMVPEATLIEFKKQNKEMAKEIKELKAKQAAGATDNEVSKDVKAIAAKYGVNEDFLSELTATLEATADKKAQDVLKPLIDKEKAEQIDKAFQKAFKDALERVPEYEGIANPAVIKQLSLLKENRDKTFTQIIEEAYASSLSGKRTIDSTKPAGGKEPAPLDFEKARKNAEYFDEVMADPKLKAEYNAQMLKGGL